ncbi:MULTISPECIES: hypothetical protein [unclassified Nocardioides]|jgi:hypothetical protein|uniref:hypothetical protein n=1 Tax=unclassified Nocardioides TaxID=2615069 RepID=UPI000702FE90|nr:MULTISPECIES: hypothetical protein [unclassified Nocardioides]KRC52892.1 hypothetical protein ASE19_10805 [Nocardioides sp. Root79]KRC72422.1 hypothetical protein ASE20_07340 [Nocardioides sp. Root240]
MAKKRWSALDPRARKAILVAGAVDGVLRAAALIDLQRRPDDEVRGSKRRWGAALALVNSAGVLPAAYFLRGRRPRA